MNDLIEQLVETTGTQIERDLIGGDPDTRATDITLSTIRTAIATARDADAAEILRLGKERDDAVAAVASGAYEQALAGDDNGSSIWRHSVALCVEKMRAAEASLATRDEDIERLRTAYKTMLDLAEADLATERAARERLEEALTRISELTPARANARDARDLHLTVKAIADSALAFEQDRAALGDRK